MSFHIIKKLFGYQIAEMTAKRMEYDIDIKNKNCQPLSAVTKHLASLSSSFRPRLE